MRELDEIRSEAKEAAERLWFVQTLQDDLRSDNTLSLRLIIGHDLFVQVFFGERTGSLYMALIEGRKRIFAVDREADRWHSHPFRAVERHEPLTDEYSHKPLWRFLAQVEDLILDHDLL